MEYKELEKEIKSFSLTFVIAITLFIVADVFFKLVTWNVYSAETYTYIFSMFFSFVVYTLIWALTKKASRATIISYLFIFIISIINELKIVYAGEPVYFSDIKFLSQSGALIKLISENISFKFVTVFFVISVVYFFILAIIVIINLKYNVELKKKKVRAAILIIDVIILILLFFPTNYTKELYLKVFFNTDEYLDFDSYTTNLSFYYRNGFINGMYGVFLNNKFIEPKNYDEEMLENILAEANLKNKKIEEKPNIIVILSEAFWDIEQIDEVKFDKSIITNFNKLKNEGELVNLISPSYGGMSENVTFEFITGGSMNYFSKGYIPVMSLYSTNDSTQIPSLVNVLKNNGYTSEVVFGKDYYNTEKTYKKIGFDTYTELVNKKETSIQDSVCTDTIIQNLEEKNSEEKLFYMISTIENHMPYSEDKYDNYDIEIINSKLDDNMNLVLRSYAQGLYNADKELGRLYEYIKDFEEPTILIFLGDHLPFLYTDSGKNVIFELEYFNTDNETLNNYRLYNTQALVLSNLEEDIELPDYLGTDMLFNYVINQFDIETNQYYKWLYTTADTLAGSNRYVSFDKEGNLYNTNELKEKMQEVYENKKLMQYKYFINY